MERYIDSVEVNPANTRHSPIAGAMLVQRLRRWPNIEPAMGECLAFAENMMMMAADDDHSNK